MYLLSLVSNLNKFINSFSDYLIFKFYIYLVMNISFKIPNTHLTLGIIPALKHTCLSFVLFSIFCFHLILSFLHLLHFFFFSFIIVCVGVCYLMLHVCLLCSCLASDSHNLDT